MLPAAATACTTRSAVCLFADIVPEKCLCYNGKIINNFQRFEFDTVWWATGMTFGSTNRAPAIPKGSPSEELPNLKLHYPIGQWS